MSCTLFSDNNFEYLSAEVANLSNLTILALRDNELVEVPPEIASLTNLRELHLQVRLNIIQKALHV